MKKRLLGFIAIVLLACSSYAIERNIVCTQIKATPKTTAQLPKLSPELIQLTKKYQQLWTASCDGGKSVDFQKVIIGLEELSKGIETAASANYDEELPRLCKWAASFAPGLVCPDQCCAATASLKDDSMARLLTYIFTLGTDEDKAFFEQYALIWGEGSNRGAPWLNETMAAGIALVDGCLNFSAVFWKEFFTEVSRKKKLLKSIYYTKALGEQDNRARTLLLHLGGNTCACFGKSEALKELEILYSFLKQSPGEQDFPVGLRKSIDQIRTGQAKILNHHETKCGGG